MVLLDVKNLKTYFHLKIGSVKAVDNVSFQLKKGEVLGLAGESGCGKTTTCLSIMRMIQSPGEIMEGQILYENTHEVLDKYEGWYNKYLYGKYKERHKNPENPKTEKQKSMLGNFNHKMKNFWDKNTIERMIRRRGIKDPTLNLLDLTDAEMRRIRGNHISMIFQGAMNAMNPVHRVQNQILEVIRLHEPQVEKFEAMERVRNILETVGIDPERGEDYPHQLSGGQRQRALIAMALVNNPDIIIADEPVTALDVIVQAQVLKATKELQKKFDLSMIMITHDLSVIAEVCESLAIMYAGRLAEYGDLRQVYKEPMHPYTEALVNAFPSIVGKKKDLFEIKGAPPDLIHPPSGCRFHPRCPKAMDVCKTKEPGVTKTKTGFVVCHLYG